jgi:hypothetical protein
MTPLECKIQFYISVHLDFLVIPKYNCSCIYIVILLVSGIISYAICQEGWGRKTCTVLTKKILPRLNRKKGDKDKEEKKKQQRKKERMIFIVLAKQMLPHLNRHEGRWKERRQRERRRKEGMQEERERKIERGVVNHE